VSSLAVKKSVTIPSDLIGEVEALAPGGTLSAYVTRALRRQVERDKLGQLVDDLRQAHGDPDPAEVARWAQILE
jgi:hypothetical protein